jgi:hypothetical protein
MHVNPLTCTIGGLKRNPGHPSLTTLVSLCACISSLYANSHVLQRQSHAPARCGPSGAADL